MSNYSVSDYLSRKKEKSNEVKTNKNDYTVDSYIQRKKSSNVNDDYIKQFSTDVNEWLQGASDNYNTGYSGVTANGADYTSKLNDLSKRSSNVRAYMTVNKDKYDTDTYDEMVKYLDSVDSNISSLSDAYKNASDVYSQYATEDDYTRASIGWLNESTKRTTDNSQSRLDYYNNLKTQAEELAKSASDTTSKNKLANMLQEISQYERTQKKLDEYFSTYATSDTYNNNAIPSDLGNQYHSRQHNVLSDGTGKENTPSKTESFFDQAINTLSDFFSGFDVYGNAIDKATASAKQAFGITPESEYDTYDRLGTYLRATDDQINTAVRNNASQDLLSDEQRSLQDGYNNYWDLMTEDEINMYYNLYSDAPSVANTYLDGITQTLQRRAEQNTTEDIENSSVLEKIFYSAASIPESIVGGITSFAEDTINTLNGNEINPYSKAHELSNLASVERAVVANDLNEITNNGTFIGVSAGDMYQYILSAGDSFVGSFIPGYNAVMGMSAASSTAKELYEQGATSDQIMTGSLLAGAAEAFFEQFSIGELKAFRAKGTATLAQAVRNWVTQSFVEMSEEMATELSNTITNAIVIGASSDFSNNRQKYIDAGSSETEAWFKTVWNDVIPEIVKAGEGGFISGGLSTGVTSASQLVNAVSNRKNTGTAVISENNVDGLVNLAYYLSNKFDSDTYKKNFGNKLKEVVSVSSELANAAKTVQNNPTEKNVGRLYQIVQTEINDRGAQLYRDDFIKQGYSYNDASQLAAEKYGNEISYLANVNNKQTIGDVATASYADAHPENNIQPNNADVGTEISGKINDAIKQYLGNNASEVKAEKQTTSQPQTATVQENQTVEAENAEGDEPISIDNAIENAADSGINLKGIDNATLDMIKSEYDGKLNATEFLRGMVEGYNYGVIGMDKKYISAGNTYSKLNDMQKEHAYRLGRASQTSKTEKQEQENTAKISGKKGRKKGTVKGEGVTLADLRKTFNDQQNRAYRILSTVSEITGVNIVLYKSEVGENGKYKGYSGKFDKSNNTIYIDINSGLFSDMDANDIGNYAMLRTFSHEFTHFIEKFAPSEYDELRMAVVNRLEEQGVEITDLVQEKLEDYTDLSFDYATREVVADCMADMMEDSTFVQQIANENKSLFRRIVEKLKEFVQNIKDYFANIGANKNRYANSLKADIDGRLKYLDSIVALWDKAAKKAVNTYQSVYATDLRNAVKTYLKVKQTQKEAPVEVKAEEAKVPERLTDLKEQLDNYSKVEYKGIRYLINEVEIIKGEPKYQLKIINTDGEINGDMITNARNLLYEGVLDSREEAVNTAIGISSYFKFDTVENTEAKQEAPQEKTAESKPTVKEIDTDKLFGAVKEAQKAATETGEEQEVKLSDYATEPQPDSNQSATPAETTPTVQPNEHFTISRNEQYGSLEVKFDGKPSENVRNVLKSRKFRWNGKTALWYGKGDIDDLTDALNKAYESETDNQINNTITEENENGKEADNIGTVHQPDTDRQGETRLDDELGERDVQGNGSERDAVGVSESTGRGTGRNDEKSDTARSESGRGLRDSESGVSGRTDVTEQSEPEKPIEQVVDTQIEQQSTVQPRGDNFIIGDSLDLPKGEKSRFKANVEAIRLIKQLDAEGRRATAEEQTILSKYVGWGGLSNAFGTGTYDYKQRKTVMNAKAGWESEFAELKSLVDDGIITEDEYKGMSESTLNAHYTSVEVIKAMYDGLSKLGFTGGRMLEPACGVGNFVGAMPPAMTNTVKSWTMVELDRITGSIAKYLYPNSDVRVHGFQYANIPDNYMDVAIGNVPFGDYGVVDSKYPGRITKAIHNYFFAKSLDKVRPGGIVMFITSSFTMNGTGTQVRQYIMDRADLLGAIRLPNTAFAGNAGTEVITDILILKKRAAGTQYAGQQFLDSPYVDVDGRSVNVNEYFVNHPEMVLGTAAVTRGMYSANTLTYNPLNNGKSLEEQIKEAFAKINGAMDYPVKPTTEQVNQDVVKAKKRKKGSGAYVSNGDGTVSQYDESGNLVKKTVDDKTAKRINGMLSIKATYNDLINAIQQGKSNEEIGKARQSLNSLYNKFVSQYGYLNDPANIKAFNEDPSSYTVQSLEKNYEKATKKDGKKIPAKAQKADIFTKNTVSAAKTVTHVDSVDSGVIVSLNVKGEIDIDYISELSGIPANKVERQIIDSRIAFKNRDGNLEYAETYLAGNVRAKLREAEQLVPFDKDYQNNIDELKRIIPADVSYTDIYVSPGAQWIPNEVYADFIAETLGGSNTRSWGGPDIIVRRTDTGIYKIGVESKRLSSSYNNTQRWGTKRRTFLNLMESIMLGTSITVKDTYKDENGDKKSVVNKVDTAAAQEMAEKISAEFRRWLWADETRRTQLAKLYNETYNSLVTPKYDGSNLTVTGLNAEFTLREHQANAVQRIISSGGNTLLAHRVGAGKTLEMASAAMKLRELGIVKKPLFIAPKSLVAQWGNEFMNYYPAANLLVADENSFTKDNRKSFINKIANNDYDAIIISYEQFEKIPMSAEFQKQFYQEQITEVMNAIAEEKAESGAKGLTIKEMEKRQKRLEAKLEKLSSVARDENNVDFEALGIDSLFVDEAHNFKNLEYTTRMKNVAGLSSSDGSKRAFDLYTKVRYLQQLNGGRGIVFATATPVMNSMAEMYIMQKYLQSDTLDQLGLKTFDAWAKQFGEIVNAVEIAPSGKGFRMKQTFSRFKNLGELQMMFRNFTDVVTKIPGLKIPKMKGGKVKIVECEPSEFQQAYMEDLVKRSENVKNVDASVDNMLKITSDGRKISYTQRMIDPSLPYEAGSKIFACCDNVVKEYKESTNTEVYNPKTEKIEKLKGTQLIFCDMATPKGKDKTKAETTEDSEIGVDEDSAQLYKDMKAYLVKKGIPAKEIAFIHDADTDQKKKQLFEDMNNGTIRVLIGSTGKMGVGMNAQRRIVAIHHLDAPWRPGDIEQRDGRAFRQGNLNDEVSKYVYVTKGSFDSRLWDKIDMKQSFINQIMNGENVGREAEDAGDVTLSAAEVKMIASGDPMVMEQIQLSNELQKLESLKEAYTKEQARAADILRQDAVQISLAETNIANAKADLKARVDNYSDEKFAIDIGGKTYKDKKEAGAAFLTKIEATAQPEKYVDIATFSGFTVKVMKEGLDYKGLLVGKNSYKFNVNTFTPTKTINDLCKIVSELENYINSQQLRLTELEDNKKAQQEILKQPFEHQSELEEKRVRYNEIMDILSPKEEQQGVEDLDEGDDAQYELRQEQTVDKGLHQFVLNILNAQNNQSVSKRQYVIGDISSQHQSMIEQLFSEELGKHVDLTGYKLCIGGSDILHINSRHGKKGTADHSMKNPTDIATVGWAVNNAYSVEIARNSDGDVDYSTVYKNSDGTSAPKFLLKSYIGDEQYVIAEVVPDSSKHIIHIISARKNKSGNGQVLNMENNSQQPTSETPLNGIATDISITQNSDLSSGNAENNFDDVQYSLRVTDKNTLDYLNKQEKNGDVIHTYKAMQVIDGKLYPPMAAKVKDENGKYQLAPHSTLGVWQQAVEDTSNITIDPKNGRGYYVLNKGNGKSIKAAYNPYEHSSNMVLNDQFEEAYQRENIVTVECIIPKSEMTSEYRAPYAKDSTGVLDWKAGSVAGQLSDNRRMVYLSRYLKPIRVIPNSEVAKMYKKILSKDNISVPFNVVTRGLLTELEKAGVPIDYEGSPIYKAHHNDVQYEERTKPLTNREILEVAVETLDKSSFTAAEREALDIFSKRLEKVKELEAKRIEQGQIYRDNQFRKGGDRDAAIAAKNRMDIYDKQLIEANNNLLSLEDKTTLRNVLNRARKVIEVQQREQDNEKLRAFRIRQKESAAKLKYRVRLTNDVNELIKWANKPETKNSTHRIPDVVRNDVIDFINSLDMTSKRALNGGDPTQKDIALHEKLTKLAATIKDRNHNIYDGLGEVVNFYDGFSDDLQTAANEIAALTKLYPGKNVINTMSAEQLKKFSELVRVLKKSIRNMNVMLANAMYQHVYEIGDAQIDYLQSFKKDPKANAVSNFVEWKNIRPAYGFERFGEAGKAIFKELKDGQDKYSFTAKKIKDDITAMYTAKEVDEWRNDVKNFEIGGDTVYMTAAQIMGLRELYLQDDSFRHMVSEQGGLRFATFEAGKVKKNRYSDRGHVITKDKLNEIIGTLTERQREVADKLQQYMATYGAKLGNEISVIRWGIEQLTNAQYYPINSDGRILQNDTLEKAHENGSLYALLNLNFLKERSIKANNRIIVYDIFDVVSNHMASMAQYNGLAIPVLDAIKWFNYKSTEGEITGSVRDELTKAFGSGKEKAGGSGSTGYAVDFVANVIKAFSGTEAQGNQDEGTAISIMKRYNMAQIAFNARVALQQPLAITRAGMILNVADIISGMKLTATDYKAMKAEMLEHSGIAVWKIDLGYYDVNISRGLAEQIMHSKSLLDKINEVGMSAAEKADEITWVAMWSACKRKVAKDNPHISHTSDEFFNLVSDLFDEVIYKTQVVDTVLTKAQFMRGKSYYSKLMGAFMSEPITSASMLTAAKAQFSDARRQGMDASAAWQLCGKNIGRTAAVYSISAILLAAVQAIADAWRDDDEYEEWYEKCLDAFVDNTIDELVPINKLPVISELWEIGKEVASELFNADTYGNTDNSTITQIVDKIVSGAKIIKSYITGDDTNYTLWGGIYKLVQAAAGVTGIPVGTATRELVDFWNNTVGKFAPSLKIKTYEAPTRTEIKEAYEGGYLDKNEAIDELISRGVYDSRQKARDAVNAWDK